MYNYTGEVLELAFSSLTLDLPAVAGSTLAMAQVFTLQQVRVVASRGGQRPMAMALVSLWGPCWGQLAQGVAAVSMAPWAAPPRKSSVFILPRPGALDCPHPEALHPTPHPLHPLSYTPSPHTPHPTTRTLYPKPYAAHTPLALRPHPKPISLDPEP